MNEPLTQNLSTPPHYPPRRLRQTNPSFVANEPVVEGKRACQSWQTSRPIAANHTPSSQTSRLSGQENRPFEPLPASNRGILVRVSSLKRAKKPTKFCQQKITIFKVLRKGRLRQTGNLYTANTIQLGIGQWRHAYFFRVFVAASNRFSYLCRKFTKH